jgi:P27 family predicted phage terminase small subunit
MGGKGSGGSNRKPIEQHLRAGTYRPDRQGDLSKSLRALKKRLSAKVAAKAVSAKTEVKPIEANTMPACPVSLDDIGREEWAKVCAQLAEKGFLESAFVSAIEGYCEAYSRWRRAVKELESGFTYEFLDGKSFKLKRRQKPEVTIAKDALNQMKAFLNDLGLTPKNLVVTPDTGQSSMDKFLNEQAKRL